MRAAYNSSLEEALRRQQQGTLASTVAAGFQEALGRRPHDDDVTSWSVVLPPVLRAAAEVIPSSAHVLVECPLPFNDQRIDLIFLGGRSGSPFAHLVELKRWQEAGDSSLSHFVRVVGHDVPHPSYQVLNYSGKLKHLHSFGPALQVGQSVVVMNGTGTHAPLLSWKFAELLGSAPVYFAPHLEGLRDRLGGDINEGASDEWIRQLLEGEYSQSQQLLQLVQGRQLQILLRASHVLAASGWGLTAHQLAVHDEIYNAIDAKRRAVFCVSGGPGSGKSLLALHLFLEAVGLGRSAVLAVRNSRLNEALRHILQTEVTGAQGMVKYFSTRGRAGVEDGTDVVADVLVCDEAQRLALKNSNVLLRAGVVVLLYDERQMLNQAEQGSESRFLQLSSHIGVMPATLQLPTPLRCRGGARYVGWLDRFLDDPASAPYDPDALGGYELRASRSPEQIRAYLLAQSRTSRVGFLASFTRASGSDNPQAPDLGRTRVPEMDPPLRWLMRAREEYVPFWVEGQCNNLDYCASIYGSQGFELDFAGLIWGSDLVIRDSRWVIGDPDQCYDSAPGARRLATVMRQNPDTALRLLRNRYRILLSRGIFGTAVHFEDAETAAFLLPRLQNV